MVEQLTRLLAPIKRRVSQLFGRSYVHLSDSSSSMQLLQVEVLKGETLDDVEHVEPYGFTSCPHEGAEAFLAAIGGRRGHSVAIAVSDRRHRKTGLQAGEVAIYTDEGDFIVIKRGGIIDVVASTQVNVTSPLVNVVASTKVTLDSPDVECTGNLSVGGNATAVGNVSAGGNLAAAGGVSDSSGSMGQMRTVYNDHDHNSNPATTKPNQSM